MKPRYRRDRRTPRNFRRRRRSTQVKRLQNLYPGLGITHSIYDERRVELKHLDEKIKRLEQIRDLQKEIADVKTE